jgi:ferric-dicitrate binding protein FerR (iron transport regulator)
MNHAWQYAALALGVAQAAWGLWWLNTAPAKERASRAAGNPRRLFLPEDNDYGCPW